VSSCEFIILYNLWPLCDSLTRKIRCDKATRASPQAAALEEISGPTARVLSLALRELNPRRTAAPRGCGRAPPAPAPPPAPSNGSVASDPLEVVDRRPVAIMAGTYRRMGRPATGQGMDTDVSVQARIAPDDSDQAG
jgi:hypothetical protein